MSKVTTTFFQTTVIVKLIKHPPEKTRESFENSERKI